MANPAASQTDPKSERITVVDVPWEYTLYQVGEQYILNVTCTSWVNRSASWDVDHTLTAEEVAEYKKTGTAYLEKLKELIAEESAKQGYENWKQHVSTKKF